jgi:UDP-N-acetylglucosamine transferase subunit ALG13
VIFVTIGSLLPFDRLIRAVDEIAPSWPEQRFHAQIGEGTYRPVNMSYDRMLAASAFAEALRSARLVIAHAGMGSLISAAEAGRPIVAMPRRLACGEISTDHQMATAKRLGQRRGVYLAMDEAGLKQSIEQALHDSAGGESLEPHAPAEFIRRVRNFIHQGQPAGEPSGADQDRPRVLSR